MAIVFLHSASAVHHQMHCVHTSTHSPTGFGKCVQLPNALECPPLLLAFATSPTAALVARCTSPRPCPLSHRRLTRYTQAAKSCKSNFTNSLTAAVSRILLSFPSYRRLAAPSVQKSDNGCITVVHSMGACECVCLFIIGDHRQENNRITPAVVALYGLLLTGMIRQRENRDSTRFGASIGPL